MTDHKPELQFDQYVVSFSSRYKCVIVNVFRLWRNESKYYYLS